MTINMLVGRKYRVTWKRRLQRKPRVFVGVFMGVDAYGDAMFDLRPAHPSLAVKPSEVITYEAVPDSSASGIKRK